MPPTLRDLGIDRMSREERLQLLGDIWDTLTPVNQEPISESHREELARRIAAADADPTAGAPWEEVRERLRGGK
jgi:putative addiction module component (TIGR02574 family)